MEIQLGSRVRDIVTGFTGIAMSRIEYLTGCTQYGVVPTVGADGKAPGADYYDVRRLSVIDRGVIDQMTDKSTDVVVVVPTRVTGGPNRDAPHG